jgi:hypothetical protein
MEFLVITLMTYVIEEIAEALLHWSSDDLMIAELKRRKLYIRDEIEQLRLGLIPNRVTRDLRAAQNARVQDLNPKCGPI